MLNTHNSIPKRWQWRDQHCQHALCTGPGAACPTTVASCGAAGVACETFAKHIPADVSIMAD